MTSKPEHAGCEYDATYYASGCGPLPYERSEHWTTFFGNVADNIVRSLNPTAVLDAGCAHGFLVEALWDRGVTAYGVDVSEYALSQVRPDVAAFCRRASVLEPLPQRYDLITCIEVLEHLAPGDAEEAIRNLAGAADRILFSSTPSDFEEPTHVNVRPALGWIESFAEAGLYPEVTYDASYLTPYAILFRRRPALERDVLSAFAQLLRFRTRADDLSHAVARERERADSARAQLEEVRASLAAAAGALDAARQETAGAQRRAERTEIERDMALRRAAALAESEDRSRDLTERLAQAESGVTYLNDVLRIVVHDELRRTQREIGILGSLVNMVQTSKFWKLKKALGRG